MIKYLVVYSFQGGTGNIDAYLKAHPRDIEDIRDLEIKVAKKIGFKEIAIINLIRLGENQND